MLSDEHHTYVDAEMEKSHLIAWARRFTDSEAHPRIARYVAAVAKMNHDELALFVAVYLLAGGIPLSDEES